MRLETRDPDDAANFAVIGPVFNLAVFASVGQLHRWTILGVNMVQMAIILRINSEYGLFTCVLLITQP